jgi:drug/metabolite transporter (DMT)-like permease
MNKLVKITQINRIKNFVFLHLIILQGSIGGIASKAAAGRQIFSYGWFFFYALVLINLLIYAFFWQRILKRFTLGTAFLNKSVVIIWGAVWGFLFFKENITINMLLGAFIVILGIGLVVTERE